MSRADFDPHAVTQALIEEDLDIDADETNAYWNLSFEILTREQTTILCVPPEGNYLLALAPIFTPSLEATIDELPAATLRAIVKLQSESVLAKFSTFREGSDTLYVALAPVPIETWDGPQLRKALHACAELAIHIRLALNDA